MAVLGFVDADHGAVPERVVRPVAVHVVRVPRALIPALKIVEAESFSAESTQPALCVESSPLDAVVLRKRAHARPFVRRGSWRAPAIRALRTGAAVCVFNEAVDSLRGAVDVGMLREPDSVGTSTPSRPLRDSVPRMGDAAPPMIRRYGGVRCLFERQALGWSYATLAPIPFVALAVSGATATLAVHRVVAGTLASPSPGVFSGSFGDSPSFGAAAFGGLPRLRRTSGGAGSKSSFTSTSKPAHRRASVVAVMLVRPPSSSVPASS